MSTTHPSKDLMDVLTMLEECRQDPVVETQRKFKRYSVRADAKLESMDDDCADTRTTILLRDISRGGIGFLCDRFLDPGTMHRVRFQVHGYPVGSQPIVVCYCRLVQDNLYMIGGQFVVEPYLMALAGVGPEQLGNDDLTGECSADDVSEFLAPDAAVDEFDAD